MKYFLFLYFELVGVLSGQFGVSGIRVANEVKVTTLLAEKFLYVFVRRNYEHAKMLVLYKENPLKMQASRFLPDVYRNDSYFQYSVNLAALPEGEHQLKIQVDMRPNVTEIYEKNITVSKPLCEFESFVDSAKGTCEIRF